MKTICKECGNEYEHDDPGQDICDGCYGDYLNNLQAEWENEQMAKWQDEMLSRQENREPSGWDMCPDGCGEAVMFCSCSEIKARRARRLEDQDD